MHGIVFLIELHLLLWFSLLFSRLLLLVFEILIYVKQLSTIFHCHGQSGNHGNGVSGQSVIVSNGCEVQEVTPVSEHLYVLDGKVHWSVVVR